jgi:tetratricopeptide (TPR) repeat protein
MRTLGAAHFKHKEPLALAAVLLSTALTFAPSLDGEFVWDDVDLVIFNKNIRGLKHAKKAFAGTFWDTGHENTRWLKRRYYRPLVIISFMVDYELYELSPAGYHATNLLLHLAVLVAFWAFLRLILPDAFWGRTAALVLMAVHGTRAEPVSWISGRTDLMMALFGFLMLIAGVHAVRSKKLRDGLLCALALFVSALCKETAAALPLVLLAYDWLSKTPGLKRRLWTLHLPLIALAVGYGLFRLSVEQSTPLANAGIGEQIALRFATLGHYGEMLLAPYSPHLMLAGPQITDTPHTITGIVVLIGVIFATLWGLRHSPLFAFGLLFCGLTLAPAANVITQLGQIAPRFVYLPLAGVGTCMAVLVSRAQRRSLRLALATVYVVLIASWITVCVKYGLDVADNDRFYRVKAAANPDHPVLQQTMARVSISHRDFAAAERWLERAAATFARYSAPDRVFETQLLRLTVVLRRTPETVHPQLKALARALDRLIAKQRGKASTLKLHNFELTLADNAKNRRLLEIFRAEILEIAATVHSRLGNEKRATDYLLRIVSRRRNAIAAWLNLALSRARDLDIDGAGKALAKARHVDPKAGAVAKLQKTLERAAPLIATVKQRQLDSAPGSADIAIARAKLLLLLNARGLAAAWIERAIAQNPNRPSDHILLVICLASCGDQPAASRALRRASRFLPKNQVARLAREAERAYRRWIKRGGRPL